MFRLMAENKEMAIMYNKPQIARIIGGNLWFFFASILFFISSLSSGCISLIFRNWQNSFGISAES